MPPATPYPQVVFLTPEDEVGLANVFVPPHFAQRQRRELLSARLFGVIQREGEVIHLIAKRLVDQTLLLCSLATSSRVFH